MMKANSPICVRLIPACVLVRTSLPDRNAPTLTASSVPATTTAESTTTATQCSATSRGSIIMPTDTKNTAPNMSRTPTTRCSTRLPSPDSATREPAMKVPSATE
jgi:hypothetical protein